MKSIRVVAAVIRGKKDDKETIFATARGYGEYKGWWEFPGGKIEEGETPTEALIREIREELSATIAVGDLIQTIEYEYPTFHLSISYKNLWKLLIDRDMKKKDLQQLAGISAASITKLGKNENVNTEIIAKICTALKCDVSDIMEVIPDTED